MMASPNLKSGVDLKYKFFLLTGSSIIILVMVYFTLIAYENGINNEVLTSNYQSSILLSSSAATGSGVAPYALAGLNWFICKSSIKAWRKWLKKTMSIAPSSKRIAKK